MSTHLLTWKTDEWDYEKLKERLNRYDSGESIQRWSCGNTKNIALGSRVFLTKQGKGYKGIFGSGHIVKEPFEELHFNEAKRKAGKKSLYVMVDFDRLYDPLTEIKIARAELDVFDPKIWDS